MMPFLLSVCLFLCLLVGVVIWLSWLFSRSEIPPLPFELSSYWTEQEWYEATHEERDHALAALKNPKHHGRSQEDDHNEV